MKSKNFVAFVLTIAMLFTFIPTGVFAEAYVAQIEKSDGTFADKYESFGDAVLSAEIGDTIWLLDNDTKEQKVVIDKSLNIELQGMKLESTSIEISGSSAAVAINDRVGTASINEKHYEGFETRHSRCVATVHVKDDASLTINGVTGADEESGTIIYDCASDDLEKAIFVSAGTLVINGGTFVAQDGAGRDSLFVYEGTVTINDGYFYRAISYMTAPTDEKPLVIKKCIINGGSDGAMWIEESGSLNGERFNSGFQTLEKIEKVFLANSTGSYVVEGSTFKLVEIGCGIYASDKIGSSILPDGTIYLVGTESESNPDIAEPKDGDKIILAPQIAGGDGSEITYVWTKDGEILNDKTGPTLNVDSFAEEDEGLYSVVATQNDQNVTLWFNLGELALQPTKTTVEFPSIGNVFYTGEKIAANISDTEEYTVTKNEGGIDVGEYEVELTLKDPSKYKWEIGDSETIILTYNILRSGTRFSEKKVLKGNKETSNFKYGDVVTIKIKVEATGEEEPYASADPYNTGASLMEFETPQPGEMALYYEDEQITDVAAPDSDGYYIFNINTKNADFEYGEITLGALYFGNDNQADHEENVVFTLVKPSVSQGTPGASYRSDYYNITFNSNGGSKVPGQRVNKNSTLMVPEEPQKEGFIFDGWYTDLSFETEYDFSKRVTVGFTLYAKWNEIEKDTGDGSAHICPSKDYKDLDVSKWYHFDTDYVIGNSLMVGIDEKVFAPDNNLTRAMLVTILYRNEGEPATNRSIPFMDIDMSAYYANAVVWAQQNGIVMGISEMHFAPDEFITREQIAAILLRYAIYKGMDAMTLEENLHFDDVDEISEYAVSAMNWAVGKELIIGKSEKTLAPKDNATRVEIAAMIHRFFEKVIQ